MSTKGPRTDLDQRFSSENATPTTWDDARRELERAEIAWLTTTRPDGRPHLTPLIAVWHDGAMHFCTGEDERKRRNLAENSKCILMTGCNSYSEGLDIVVEGDAVRVTDGNMLGRIAAAFESKYGADWHFDVGDGVFLGQGQNAAWVYRVEAVTAFGYARGEQFSQTRWQF